MSRGKLCTPRGGGMIALRESSGGQSVEGPY